MHPIKVFTIGVYGFDEAGFFNALQRAGVGAFIDIRQRRGVRGARYAFANAVRLQARLEEMGIAYIHCKDLAPTHEIRSLQKASDHELGVSKTLRDALSPVFIQVYRENILRPFDPQDLFEKIPIDCTAAALFCVESQPRACHRSLVAQFFSDHYDFATEDILPWKS
jgi:uncharacterized protein (DUF488 family)